MKLLLIRHAESVGNQEQRLQGQADFALSFQGQRQAAALAQSLSTQSWCPTHVYSSPLQRAIQTATILLQGRELAIAGSEALQEIHLGILQGLTWAEAQAQYPELCCALEASPTWIPIPEAESLIQVRDRAKGFVESLLNQHIDSHRIWIITHGGLLPYLIAALLGCDRVWGLEIPPTALFEFWLDRDRWPHQDENLANNTLWQIRRFNDLKHLKT